MTSRLAASALGAAILITATLTGTAAAQPSGPAASRRMAADTASGVSCAPGEGVTMVVDFNGLPGGIQVSCAEGVQDNGFAALANAGFGAGSDSGPAGTVCTINGQPSQGYPYCWLTGGYWSYWRKDRGGAWAFSPVGASAGPIPVDTVLGWSWAQDFASGPPRADEDSVPPATTTTTSTVTTSTTAPTSSTSTVPGTTVAPTPEDPAAPAALDWLERELTQHDGAMPAAVGEGSDWGLTIDAIIALQLGGRGNAPATLRALEQVTAHVVDYTTGSSWGEPQTRFAGPTAKTIVGLSVSGRPTTQASGNDLAADLVGLMRTSGADLGRFSDTGDAATDTSNGFSQALGVLALARTQGVPAAAVSFLLAQQCPGGGFRIVYASSGGCTNDAQSDTDSTSLAIQALQSIATTTGSAAQRADTGTVQGQAGAAMARAATWLGAQQDPMNGAFGGTGVTAAPNSNSSGLAAQSLLGIGQSDQARKAAVWITTLQLSEPADDAGAIAYNPAALAEAETDQISEVGRDQWRRATSQAVLGLGLPSLGSVQGVVLAEGQSPGDGQARNQVPDSPTTGGSQVGTLPRTGSNVDHTLITGLALLAAGLLASAAGRRRARRSTP